MNAIMFAQDAPAMDAINPCIVVVLYDDAVAREKATEMCDRLLNRFDRELAFKLNHWNFKELGEPAAEALAHADVVLFSTHGWDLPAATVRWLEFCTEARTKLEGVLACMIVDPAAPPGAVETLLYRLRQAAFGLKMDFLPLVPPLRNGDDAFLNWPAPMVESRDQSGNSHWGLNE